jgi:cyanophycinase
MPESRNVGRGALVIIGGHEDREGRRTILREVARRLDGQPLLVCAAASKTPERYLEIYRGAFADLGVEVTELVPGPDAGRLLADAGGVFLTGGKQARLLAALDESGLSEQLRSFVREGGALAGTSAGASVLSDVMLSRGRSEETPEEAAIEFTPGLGVVTGVLIDQHFAERGRIGRLVAAIAQRPELCGIGIDEDTALIVEGGRATVAGAGAVYVVASDDEDSDEGAAYDLRVLREGQAYDLPAR